MPLLQHRASELRDYFAARAPEAPDWFQPKMDHLPQVPPKPALPAVMPLSAETPPSIAAWAEEKARIEAKRAEHRFIFWRWYYADLMVSHRGMITDVPVI